MLYGHRYGLGAITAISFIMSLSFPICIQMVYLEYNSQKWYARFVNALIILIFVGPFVFGLIEAADSYYNYQLEHFPKTVYGKIVSFETTHGKGGTKHFATFNYIVDKEPFTQRVSNDDFYYKMNDSLKMIVSANDPEIFSIIGVKSQ